MIRTEVVEALVELMSDVIISRRALGSSGSELLSAALTFTNRLLTVMIKNGADPADVRRGVEMLMLNCSDASKPQ